MNLDADRLAKLAGLPVANRKNLSEASNRSLHDDSSVSDEQDYRFGKGQLAEEQKYGGNKGDLPRSRRDFEEGHCVDEGSYEMEEADQADDSMPEGRGKHDPDLEETVTISEEMLANEIARMRKERLQENELRGIIRAEIGSIIKDLKKESSSSKVRKRASKMRGVTMGIPGPGFR